MNYSTAVFLINDKVRAVYGTYESHEAAVVVHCRALITFHALELQNRI